MTFSNVYGSLLLPFIQNYKEAKNEKGRKVVVGKAADAVRKSRNLLEDKGADLPKDLQMVCFLVLHFCCPIQLMLIALGCHLLYQRVY